MKKILLFLYIILIGAAYAESSCLYCHSNESLMRELGFPQFYFTNEQVWNESKMLRVGLGGPSCQDCHLGNPENKSLEGAHSDMPRLLVISMKGVKPIKNRYEVLPSLVPQRKKPPYLFFPNSEIRSILYHDRDPKTLAFSPKIANATCGKCHAKQVEDFLTTPMGLTMMQSRYSDFVTPPMGPHNCGYWLTDFEKIRDTLSTTYTLDQAKLNERACQQCHTSCLDCHYNPSQGRHFFIRRPPPTSCDLGGGRGICHVGAEDYRRGAGFYRQEASIPSLPPDVHYLANLSCLDCHIYQDHNISRKATCRDCHIEIERDIAEGVHRNVSCEACHVQVLGGYQIVFWNNGSFYGELNPLTKINYYGSLSNPILIRDRKGIWIPVKPIPHAVFNQKFDLPRTGIRFRDIPGVREDSRDAYAVCGTVSNLPSNNKAILWIHMDKVSHGFGKARSCSSCHDKPEQRAKAKWIMFGTKDTHVFPVLKNPFTGEHEVVGNASGIFIVNLRNTSEIDRDALPLAVNFAPWIYGLQWSAPGDLSMPAKNRDICEKKCLECHISPHATINPKYLKIRPYLKVLFFIALVGIGILAYRTYEKER
jgi:hypothetical protein